MKAMLDTQTLFWIITDDSRLSTNVRDIYLDTDNQVFISMALLWEMAIKINLGKLIINGTLADFITNHIKGNAIQIMAIELAHILALDNIPEQHFSLFTRLVLAQCLYENIPILSANAEYDVCPVTRIW